MLWLSRYFIQSEISIHATWNNLICCRTGLNVGGKRATLHFNSFCSNVAKQGARFCCPFYRSLILYSSNKYLFFRLCLSWISQHLSWQGVRHFSIFQFKQASPVCIMGRNSRVTFSWQQVQRHLPQNSCKTQDVMATWSHSSWRVSDLYGLSETARKVSRKHFPPIPIAYVRTIRIFFKNNKSLSKINALSNFQ